MRARLLATENEEGGSVTLEVNGFTLVAMDHLVYGRMNYPKLGEEFDVAFSGLYREEASINAAFLANPLQEARLQSLGGWSYRALGRVIAGTPGAEQLVMVDCGVCVLPPPFDVSDVSQVGEYVGFTVERLDAHGPDT